MKKIIFCVFTMVCSIAGAQFYNSSSLILTQQLPGGLNGQVPREILVLPANAHGLLSLNGQTEQPQYFSLGSTLGVSCAVAVPPAAPICTVDAVLTTGPQGAIGATGATGPQGVPGTTDYLALTNLPNLTQYATTTQLSAKFNTPTGSTAQYLRGDGTLATLPVYSPTTAYAGTTSKVGSYRAYESATIASGVAVFQLTVDGTSGGTAIYPNEVFTDSPQPIVNDATASYQMSWAFTNSNKTLTVTVNKLTTANILTGLLGQAAAPNGTVVKLAIEGR